MIVGKIALSMTKSIVPSKSSSTSYVAGSVRFLSGLNLRPVAEGSARWIFAMEETARKIAHLERRQRVRGAC